MIKDLFIKISFILIYLFIYSDYLMCEELFLPEIKVIGKQDKFQDGKRFDFAKIKNFPAKNSSVSDVLKNSAMVRTSNDSDSTMTGGEILPERISVSGGKFYDNNFNMDGFRFESWFDPSSDSSRAVTDIPNHFMTILPGIEIFDSITLYDHDVPVRYGGFTGGVIDCKTKVPGKEFSGSTKILTTKSKWTSFHLKDNFKNEFEESVSDSMEPEFVKYKGSLSLNGPVSEDTSFILSYDQLMSDIPLQYFNRYKNQTRKSKSVFGKFNFDKEKFSGWLSILYTPYQGSFFMPNSLNSDYTLSQNSLVFSGENTFFLKDMKIKFKASYRSTDYDRDALNKWYKWSVTQSVPWGAKIGDSVSKEGGFGSLSKNESFFDTELIVDGDKYPICKYLSYRPEAGLFYSRVSGYESRDEASYIYSSPVTDNPFFNYENKDDGIIPGEQYFSKRLVYFPYNGREKIDYYGLFLQEEIFIKNFFLRAGLRVSKDDFLENINISRRVVSKIDLFHGNIRFSLGYNRYYGHGFLYQKLKEARGTVYKIESRTTYKNNLTDWVEDSSTPYRVYRFSGLRTPYTDEYTSGIGFKFLGKSFQIGYIRRYFKDQFASSFGYADGKYTIYTFNNYGESDYEGVKLSGKLIDRKKNNLSFNLSWQQTKSFIEDYNNYIDDETSSELVYYDGRLIFRDEMPAANYNTPVTATLIFYKKFFDRVDVSSILRYRSPFEKIVNTGDTMDVVVNDRINPDTGESYKEAVPIYANKKTDDKITIDISLRIPILIYKKYKASVLFNIFNLLDYGKDTDERNVKPYMGRQIWAGIKFDF